MTEEINTDYCIVGGGILGVVLASRLAISGKKILIMEQGPRFTEGDRFNMLLQSKETLNDFADYNDDVEAATMTPHSPASHGDQVVEWTALRLFGVGGTALHFEGIMARPREDDLQVKTRYGYGRDWPITYSELEPCFFRRSTKRGFQATMTIPMLHPDNSLPIWLRLTGSTRLTGGASLVSQSSLPFRRRISWMWVRLTAWLRCTRRNP